MPYDYERDKPLAERAVQRLCVGAQIEGLRFGVIPQLLISDPPDKPPIRGQVYLNLASTWRVYPTRPTAFPKSELEIEELEDNEALRQLCDLRDTVITCAEMGEDAPDLILTFDDRRVFFLNGRHEQYETWQLGVAFSREIGTVVVACPGNEVAVWSLPESVFVSPAV